MASDNEDNEDDDSVVLHRQLRDAMLDHLTMALQCAVNGSMHAMALAVFVEGMPGPACTIITCDTYKPYLKGGVAKLELLRAIQAGEVSAVMAQPAQGRA